MVIRLKSAWVILDVELVSWKVEKMKRILLCAALGGFGNMGLAAEMPALAEELGCVNCHAIDRKVTGPAWAEVSKRYRTKRDDPAFVEQLAKKVSRGGSGNWGDLPMIANDPAGAKHDKIVELVKFVLSLSDLPEYKTGMH